MDTLLRMEKWPLSVEVYFSSGSLFSSGERGSDKAHYAGLL